MPVPPALVPSPVEVLADERLDAAGVGLLLKRDDLIHPDLPGNKWRKLKYNLEAAQAAGATRLLTFGGAYSNHIRAVAAAGAIFGFETVGVIRGEAHDPLNPSLQFAVDHGMRLTYLDRQTYRRKTEPDVIDRLGADFGDFYLIPEGGSNALAVRGCMELAGEITDDFDVICCAVGTGGTLAGIAAGLGPHQRAIGFSSLKGGDFLSDDVAVLQRDALGEVTGNWAIETDYHFGGYAKSKPELVAFVDDFEARHGLRLDWVYVARMMYGVYDLAAQGRFPRGTTIVAVITGPDFEAQTRS
ncbi:1-aminocyclopropane-1-carboxylate deaminase [Promicromonospora sp. AC04]|uniref:1-aminocyclopropane-1-carboxylate deaminase/D-cysteine desulfhydrase n=1 Tax=Promicromonospora sp. AC04 TaxID=2135723 RepID=UPI000D3ADDEC|nr:pyridoxal-phosphate dependent enzyme [Promicromonospora sp. AC04]PUB24490.1 1-aminocyclopropane-1-carboxylate deaminase [Promicromonospora sp. AC04]